MTDVHQSRSPGQPLAGTDRVVDGVRLHVVVHGQLGGRPGEGRVPVLLLHGMSGTSAQWRGVQRDLAHHAQTVAPDLAGLGRSERARGRLDPASQARLLRTLLDDLGAERVVVAGHGIGGAVAVHLAVLDPDRVAGLVLMSTAMHADVWPPAVLLPLLVPGARTVGPALLRRAPRVAAALVGRALGPTGRTDGTEAAQTAQPDEVDAYLDVLHSPASTRGLRDVAAAVDMVGVEAAWDVLRAGPPPTLVLWGEEDTTYRLPYGRRVAGELGGTALVPVVGAGHQLPRQRPERVAEEIAGFAAELASG